MFKKISVAILGATGAVGQQLVLRLANHPLFEIAHLGASPRSEGKTFEELVRWMLPQALPSAINKMTVTSCLPKEDVPITFSALSNSQARIWEIAHRDKGKIVFSASSAHRMLEEVPLIAAQVNFTHIELIKEQIKRHSGAIIAKPNCVVTGLALTLKPLMEIFGLKSVMCHAMQSVSGGGFDGVAALEILDNLLPLPEEETKIETETKKVLGEIKSQKIELVSFDISARSLRVAVTEGHLLAVEFSTEKKATKIEIVKAWLEWNDYLFKTKISDQKAIMYLDHQLFPQPRYHRYAGGGMTTVIGSLKACSVMDWKFLSLTHNTIQGAAGGLVLLAENYLKNFSLEKLKSNSSEM